ncbi:uncharacterized protein LOC123310722 [Coccinella septempunctata]|uniref:uncharacterized protein LOC123310722 n=1 Tax=Coccinella septempunctata TaxID=41139 RepID=UPI001D0639A6|nr:uncharacterized protein LOC123310722 [Coccinella septempunctata]
MSGYRNPYTVEEERKILHYIIRKNGFYRLRGLQFWKELERDELPSRTYQSLHERFRKYIINNIRNPAYDLSVEEQKKLKRIYEEGAKGKRIRSKTTQKPVPTTRTEVHGNLAKNFFDISDSDDSDDCIAQRTSRRNESHIRSKNDVLSTVRNEAQEADERKVVDLDMNPSADTRMPENSVVEIDSSTSSSESEIFNLMDQ